MIEELENIKLIRELNYLKSEFEYKTNLVQILNIDFLNSVEKILETNSELKKIYDEKKNSRIEIANKPIEHSLVSNEEVIEYNDSDPKIKNIYRQIVKMTHPDKTKDDGLSLIYNQANLALKEGKNVEMILLCDRLNIPFEISYAEKQDLKKEITSLRNQIFLLESSYSYQWYSVEEDILKSKITLDYIRNSIT